MSPRRTDFPHDQNGYALGMSGQTVMLDGMEVLFDKTVGLAPVALVADQPAPAPTTNGTDAGGTRRRA